MVLEKVRNKLDGVLIAGSAMCASTLLTYAESDVFTQGTTAAKSLYEDVVSISTPIAAAAIVIALLFTMFSHNPKIIDGGRDVAKKVAISWVVINGLGYAFVTVKKYLGDGGAVVF